MIITLYVFGQLRDITELGPLDVDLQGTASALAKINRFGGHTPMPYSVAQHAVLVSHLVPEEHALTALHHDDTEAVVGDLAGPIKASGLVPGYVRLENRIWRQCIAPKYGLPARMPKAVKTADKEALLYEQRVIQGREDGEFMDFGGLPHRFDYVWDWRLAEARYKYRHQELVARSRPEAGDGF